MGKLTRRVFFKQASLSVASVGVLSALPGLTAAAAANQNEAAAIELDASTGFEGPLIAHVNNFRTGEISLMVGSREVILHDPELVKRFLRAVQ